MCAPGDKGQVAKLCEVIGAPELPVDARFATNALRSRHRDELKRLLGAQLARFADCEALADRLIRAGVPCAPTHDAPAVLADSHTKHRGMVVEIGESKGVASPIKLSRTPATCRREPPERD